MAIDVTCTSCKTRFQVSDKFAGKQGPCPKCKATIKVPDKSEQVVIHAPEETAAKGKGPKGTAQPDFKPIAWKETRLSTPMIAAIVGAVFMVLLTALIVRIASGPGKTEPFVLALGAVLLAPPLAFAGYTFLRDGELEPYRGKELLLRLIAPSVVYPALWGLYWFTFWYLGFPPDWYSLFVVVPVAVAIGAVTMQASLDLELGSGALHYTMYLFATVLLRIILGFMPHWQV